MFLSTDYDNDMNIFWMIHLKNGRNLMTIHHILVGVQDASFSFQSLLFDVLNYLQVFIFISPSDRYKINQFNLIKSITCFLFTNETRRGIKRWNRGD